ncbi:hypothetical protein C8J56DRAFT_1171971 [Mycena floridula]|nr:hypothetical protein C8J56DRAFT_1171971 [Mycena floridula]
MLFRALFLFALALPVFSAPIPRGLLSTRVESRADSSSGGWPHSANFDEAKSDFGISGGFKSSDLTTFAGEPTLVASYPKGSYAGSKTVGIGGFIFEAAGTEKLGKTVQFSYEVKFGTESDKDFDFVEGGKLPGLYGGSDPKTAASCAGGHHDNSCWSARIMWRKDGEGELYAYLPTANNEKPICKTNDCTLPFGASINRGAWRFPAGYWTTVMEEVTVGNGDASITVYINGTQKIHFDNLVLPGDIRGAMVHTFFGGSTSPIWQSPKDQQAYFRNLVFKNV